MCEKCDHPGLLSKIEEMQDTGDYDWAAETLNGIHETVSGMQHATDKQWSAITNIENSTGGRR